jgi:hypothetical protein
MTYADMPAAALRQIKSELESKARRKAINGADNRIRFENRGEETFLCTNERKPSQCPPNG